MATVRGCLVRDQALRSVGFGNLPTQRMFELFDENGNGIVEYKEFLVGLSTLKGYDETSLRSACARVCVAGRGVGGRP